MIVTPFRPTDEQFESWNEMYEAHELTLRQSPHTPLTVNAVDVDVAAGVHEDACGALASGSVDARATSCCRRAGSS